MMTYIFKVTWETIDGDLIRYYGAHSIIGVYRYLTENGADLGSIKKIERLKRTKIKDITTIEE